MRDDAVQLEESRLQGIDELEQYPWFKDRHRVFPAVFENRQHKRVLDISAGVGCAAQNIRQHYPAEILCNDISPTCLKILHQLGIPTVSFDIDNPDARFPIADGDFDAVISLVTIEHLMHPDHFIRETKRILREGGYLYISTPNYACLYYALKLWLDGRSFHNPLSSDESTRYEFYAHIRYFTFNTLLEFVSSFGFGLDTVYIALPEWNSHYRALLAKSKPKALLHRHSRWLMYHLLSPRWTAEPILCFQKGNTRKNGRLRKVVL